jgi:hypothetical protein
VEVAQHLLVQEVSLVDEEYRVDALRGQVLDVGRDRVEDGGGRRAMVFGRSKTAKSGMPPNAAKWSTRVRSNVSTRSFSTMVTSTQREYLSREAKKWMRFDVLSMKRTSTWPKSCCENSPGNPSKRTTGRTAFGRKAAMSA